MKSTVRKFASVKDQFGRPYPLRNPSGYLIPVTACDSLVIKNKQVLLITRKKEPQIGKLAFPGGHFDIGESGETCATRELEEECNLKATSAKLFKVYGNPTRDARKHVISFVYEVEIEDDSTLQAGDDAATAKFYALEEVLATPEAFAFDHHKILTEFLENKS